MHVNAYGDSLYIAFFQIDSCKNLHYSIPIFRQTVTVTVSGLPLIKVFPGFREQICHDIGDDAAVGHQAGIILDFRECHQDTTGHLCAAFTAGKEIGPIVSGDSDLLIRTVLQIIVAVHLRCAEIYPPESRVSFVGDAWNKQLHGFIGSHHAAG